MAVLSIKLANPAVSISVPTTATWPAIGRSGFSTSCAGVQAASARRRLSQPVPAPRPASPRADASPPPTRQRPASSASDAAWPASLPYSHLYGKLRNASHLRLPHRTSGGNLHTDSEERRPWAEPNGAFGTAGPTHRGQPETLTLRTRCSTRSFRIRSSIGSRLSTPARGAVSHRHQIDAGTSTMLTVRMTCQPNGWSGALRASLQAPSKKFVRPLVASLEPKPS